MSADHHWAGIASARLLGREVVPGFVRVVFHCGATEPDAIEGSFVPGGADPSLTPGAPVELIFPRDVVGRAHLIERKGGVFAFEGALPWTNWRNLVQLTPIRGDRPGVVQKSGFLELCAGSRVTPENWVSLEELDIKPGQRLLMDYRNVMEILSPFEAFLDAARQLDALGLKIAMVGSGALVMGLTRLASQMANLEPSKNIRVFGDYDEGRYWLLE